MASAWDRRNAAQVWLLRCGCRVDAGVFEDLPHGGGGDPDAEDEQLAVDAPVPPRAVLPREAQHQQPDRPNRARPADTLRPRDPGVTGGDQVAVPAQHRLRTHQQPHPVQHVAGESVQQGRQEGPVGGSEPDLATLAVELPFEDRDLVAQGQDLHVLGPVAHRQQPQHRQPVGHGEVRQSKQHSTASSPIGAHRRGQLGQLDRVHVPLTRADVIVGTRNVDGVTRKAAHRSRGSNLANEASNIRSTGV